MKIVRAICGGGVHTLALHSPSCPEPPPELIKGVAGRVTPTAWWQMVDADGVCLVVRLVSLPLSDLRDNSCLFAFTCIHDITVAQKSASGYTMLISHTWTSRHIGNKALITLMQWFRGGTEAPNVEWERTVAVRIHSFLSTPHFSLSEIPLSRFVFGNICSVIQKRKTKLWE